MATLTRRLPDARTGHGDNYNLISDGTHQYAVMVTRDSGMLVAKRTWPHSSPGFDSTHTFTGAESTALGLPVEDDEHNYPAIFRDGQGYLWVLANMHNDVLRGVKSNSPDDITAWTAITKGAAVGAQVPFSSPITDRWTYPTPLQFSDGTVFLYMRSDTSGYADSYFWTLGPAATTFTGPTKIFKGCNVANAKGPGIVGDDNSADTQYNWNAYPQWYVEPSWSLHPDRLHVFWMWRQYGFEDFQYIPSYMYSDDKGATWKNVSGTTVTLPVDPINTTSVQTGLTSTNTGFYGTTNMFTTGGAGVTVNPTTGRPEAYVSLSPKIFITWNGSSWSQTNLPASNLHANHTFPHGFTPVYVKGSRWLLGQSSSNEPDSNRRVRLVDSAASTTSGATVLLGGGITSTFESTYDPYAHANAQSVEVLVPDGDVPKVFTFGTHSGGTSIKEVPDALNATFMQAVLDAVPDGPSKFMPTVVRLAAGGTYDINEYIWLENRNNIVIDGNGATWRVTDPAPYATAEATINASGAVGDATVTVDDTTDFDASGAFLVENTRGAGSVTRIAYTSKNATQFLNCTKSNSSDTGTLSIGSRVMQPNVGSQPTSRTSTPTDLHRTPFMLYRGSNIRFTNINFDMPNVIAKTFGGFDDGASIANTNGDAGLEAQHAIRIEGTDGVEIDNCTVNGVFGDFIYIINDHASPFTVAKNIKIHDNDFSNNGRMGLSNLGSDNVEIYNNTFDGVRMVMHDFEPNTSNGTTTNFYSHDNTYSNIRSNFWSAAGGPGDGFWGDVTFDNEHLTGASRGLFRIQAGSGSDGVRRGPLTITNCDGVQTDTNSNDYVIQLFAIDGVTIQNNTFPCQVHTGPPFSFVEEHDCTDLDITGNDITPSDNANQVRSA